MSKSPDKYIAFAVNGPGGRQVQLRREDYTMIAGSEKVENVVVQMMTGSISVNRDAIRFLTQEDIDNSDRHPKGLMEPLTMGEREAIRNCLRY